MNSISSLNTQPGMAGIISPKNNNPAAGPSFKDFLVDSIGQVNSMQQQADQAVD